MKSVVYKLELPTWLIILAVYGGFSLATWYAAVLPGWLLFGLGGILVCWQSHLQHELLHGHPTRWRWLNTLFGLPSLNLLMPYAIYRELHLAHHAADPLTDPRRDPESFFVSDADWSRMGRVRRILLTFNQSFAGRMLVGPFLTWAGFLRDELRRLGGGDLSHLGAWVVHGLAMAGLLYWVIGICDLSFGEYLAYFVWPGSMLNLVRSYAEHWPDTQADGRTAVVHSPGFFSLLFLNNNLHVVHHDRPGLAWYLIPSDFRRRGGEFVRAPVFQGYRDLIRRYGLRAKARPNLA